MFLIIIKNLKNVHFDSLFHEGILDDEGNGELYCSEFIHYAFKNRLDLSAKSQDMPSPYDSLNTSVLVNSTYAQNNLKRWGWN